MAVPAPLVPPSSVMHSASAPVPGVMYRQEGKSDQPFGPPSPGEPPASGGGGGGGGGLGSQRRPEHNKGYPVSPPVENLALRDLYWSESKTPSSTPSPSESASPGGVAFLPDTKPPVFSGSPNAECPSQGVGGGGGGGVGGGVYMPDSKPVYLMTEGASMSVGTAGGAPLFRSAGVPGGSDHKSPFSSRGSGSSDGSPASLLSGLYLAQEQHKSAYAPSSPPASLPQQQSLQQQQQQQQSQPQQQPPQPQSAPPPPPPDGSAPMPPHHHHHHGGGGGGVGIGSGPSPLSSRGVYRVEPGTKSMFPASPAGDIKQCSLEAQFAAAAAAAVAAAAGGGGGGGVACVSGAGGDKKVVYCTPPPVENTPAHNECRLVELHGAKVASFTVHGQELICLPQAFDLFLKPLVGGLHTVYTKLKRLHIVPVVCNVEQVRVLRGMGAIQPGVNRCKLISRHDFETLYTDCTNTSSRPGRPPKRAHGLLSPDSMMSHGLLSPGVLSPPGLGPTGGVSSGAAFPESLKMKKLKLEAVNGVHGNGNPGNKEGDASEMCSASAGGGEGLWDRGKHHSPKTPLTPPGMSTQPLSATHGPPTSHPLTQLQQSSLFSNGLEHMGSALPFMMMSHPLLPVSLPHAASVTMAMGHMTHLGGGGGNASNMAAGAGEAQPGHPLRLEAVLKERSEERDSSPEPSPMRRQRSEEPPSPRHCSPPALAHGSIERLGGVHQNGLCVGPVPLPAMAPRPGSHARDDAKHDGNDRGLAEQKDGMAVGMLAGAAGDKQHSLASLAQLHADFPAAAFLFPDGLSSTETLLTNIQGLLKVAADSARAQDKQAQLEKSELRMEILREREVREALERELATEQRNRELVQKRLKKEKKAKRKLQEALEFEGKRREQAEHALTQATNPDGLRGLGEPLSPMMEGERSGQGESERVAQQDSRMYFKNPGLY